MKPTIFAPFGLADAAPRARSLATPVAVAVGGSALTLGVVIDTLFHDAIGPVSFALAIALVVLTMIALVWRSGRVLSPEATAWLAGAAVFASLTTLRNSSTLQALDTIATLGCLILAGVRLRNPRAGILTELLRDTIVAALSQFLDVAIGIFPLTLREMAARRVTSRLGTRAHRIARPVLLVVTVLLVFGSLLRSADPIFASLATLPTIDVENLVSHACVIGVFTVVIAGWSRSALLPEPTRLHSPAGYGFTLGASDIITILGTLNVLFTAFVLAQLGWFFGGEQFLHARTGLTAAQYARGGFFQILWVVALVVPVLVVTRGALKPDALLSRRHTLLSIPIIVLLGAMIGGAVARLNLYVSYYGFTTDRLYPLVFMGWLFATLLWLSVTVLRDWQRPFMIGATLSAAATLLSLNALDPDAFVARINVARAAVATSSSPKLDITYLANLSGGATPYAIDALLAAPTHANVYDQDRCDAAGSLLRQFGPGRNVNRALSPESDASWRYWNADDGDAVRIVRAHAHELLEIRRNTCHAPLAPARGATN